MIEHVSFGAAGKRLGGSGGDIRRGGYPRVTATWLGARYMSLRCAFIRRRPTTPAPALRSGRFLNAPGGPGPDG
jgi:hypothetical protein